MCITVIWRQTECLLLDSRLNELAEKSLKEPLIDSWSAWEEEKLRFIELHTEYGKDFVFFGKMKDNYVDKMYSWLLYRSVLIS